MTFTEFVIQRQTYRNFDTSSGSDRLTDRLTDASTNPYVQTGREVAKFGFRLWRGVLSDKLFLTVYLVVGSIILLGWIGLGLVKNLPATARHRHRMSSHTSCGERANCSGRSPYAPTTRPEAGCALDERQRPPQGGPD